MSVPSSLDITMKQKTLARIDALQHRSTPLAVSIGTVKKYGDDSGGRLAAVVAYYGFFSVFPALLALVSIVGFALDDNPEWRDDIIDSALGTFPVIGSSIDGESLGGSGWALAIGIGTALWAGLGAMGAAQYALNEAWDVPIDDRPKVAGARLRSFAILVVFGLGIVGTTALAQVASEVSLAVVAEIGIIVGHIAVNVVLLWISFRVLCADQRPWMTLLPGAIVAGVGYFVLQYLGSYVIDHFVANASDTYGTFAVVIGLLTWFHLLAQITLFAAELNVVRAKHLYPRELAES